MKALMKVEPRPGALEIRQAPRPVPKPTEVVLNVAAASICGSDLHMADWHPMARWMKTPVILGHEFAGTVTEVGSDVRDLRAGDAVAVESVIWCGRCPQCRAGKTNVCVDRRLFGIHEPGGLAEAVAVPERLTHKVPESLPIEHAALAEPTTVALHAVLLQPPRPGDTVLVTGPGPVGLLAGRIARAFGARVFVSGTSSDAATRLPAARDFGLEPLDPTIGLRDALSEPVDLVLECSGAAAAVDNALYIVKRGGGITFVGMPNGTVPFDMTQALRAEIALRPTYFGTWGDFERALHLLADQTIPVAQLIANYSLDQAVDAFADASAQKVLKPLVRPS